MKRVLVIAKHIVRKRRPPRGGRGLKFLLTMGILLIGGVAPLAGGVD